MSVGASFLNEYGAASKKGAHGVDPVNGRKCVELGTHPYAPFPRRPYKKFRGDFPRLAGIRPENWFLDSSLPGVCQPETLSYEQNWTCYQNFRKGRKSRKKRRKEKQMS